jgi:hypothetical protein
MRCADTRRDIRFGFFAAFDLTRLNLPFVCAPVAA